MFAGVLLVLFALGLPDPTWAGHKVAHCRPAAAAAAFPANFPPLHDQEWGFPLGGWGGGAGPPPGGRRPVVFVHGNSRDAGDWDEPGHSVKQRFLEAGYSPRDLWALSYNGVTPAGSSWPCQTDNISNVPELRAFVMAVLAHTGAPAVDLIAHSLGVTVARKMLQEHPELRPAVSHFVAIAGANHGTTTCRRLWLIWFIGWNDFIGCNELTPGSAWLHQLNGPEGEHETPGPTRYLTIYEGTGVDILFRPWVGWVPVGDQDSPALKGAINHKLPGLTHDELRVHPDAVSVYLQFIQQ